MELRYRRRPTRRLEEVCGSDLLPAHEKLIAGTIDGFYKLTDEAAYFRLSGDKAALTVDEFEKKIKKEIHPNFFVAYNPIITAKHMIQGHQVGFYVPEMNGFVPLAKVGRSSDKLIPANSIGGVEKYVGRSTGKIREKGVIFRGWVAGYEMCKEFIKNLKIQPLTPARVVSSTDFFIYKKMYSQLGGQKAVKDIFMEARKIATMENDKIEVAVALQRKQEREKIKAVTDFVLETAAETVAEAKPEAKPEVKLEVEPEAKADIKEV